MSRKAVVIGAGINGLVAANYLVRAGCSVLMLEKKDTIGGACTYATFEHEGRQYQYPTGASVFGMMQDFVFHETGLSKRFNIHRSGTPPQVIFKDETAALSAHTDAAAFAAEAKDRWGETGDIGGFERDLGRVRRFLTDAYRRALSPSWELAVASLGETIARRFITGSALELLHHYFTKDRTKIYTSMPVTESGPVPLDQPGTAFTIAAMASGSVLPHGQWGHINGGLYRLVLHLGDINRELGVEIVTGATLQALDTATRTVQFSAAGHSRQERADAIFFATDPLTAAAAIGNTGLTSIVKSRKYLGSSGKCVLHFREPIVWKGSNKTDNFASATRYIYAIDDFSQFLRSNESMRGRNVDFSPCCYQVYCEGAAQRCLGTEPPQEYISVFFKDVGYGKRGTEIPEVKQQVINALSVHMENPDALFHSTLMTPRDLHETFFFPEGNIDHQEMRAGQTYGERGFSSDPAGEYYRMGGLEKIYYCGAGSYPCGSVAGTPGYMAVAQYLRRGE